MVVAAAAPLSSSSLAAAPTDATTEAVTDEENDGRPRAPHVANSALLLTTATTTDAMTTAPLSTGGSSSMMNHFPVETTISTATAIAAADDCRRRKAIASSASTDRIYRILALSMVAVALIFCSGFGLGMRYSKSKCQGSNSISSTSSKTTADATLTVEACQELLQSAQQAAATSNYSDSASTTIPNNPSMESSSSTTPLVPPFVDDASQRISCLDHDVALADLRRVLLFDVHYYIHSFAHYIRHVGTNTMHYWYENHIDEVNAMIAASAAATETSMTSNKPSSISKGGSRARRSMEHLALTTPALHGTTSLFQRAKRSAEKGHVPNRGQQRRRRTANRQTRRLQYFETSVSSSSENSDFTSDRHGSSSADSSNASGKKHHAVVQVADVVQTNGEDVFLVYDNEIVVLHAATNALRRRLQIPKGHKYSTNLYIDGILLVSGNDSDDDGGEPTDDLLVVFFAETQYTEWSVDGGYSSKSSNTTVLVYNANMNSDKGGTILARRSLPGTMEEAFAIGPNIHIVLPSVLDMSPLWDYLTPASLQSNKNVDPDASIVDPPRLLLNETQYLDLAFEQVDLYFEALFTKMAANLDCTGYVPRLDRPDLNRNATFMGGVDWRSLIHIVSFDMSRSSSMSSSTLLAQSGTIAFLPGSPSIHTWNMHVSDTNLVLASTLWSGAPLTNTSQPLTWLVAFAFSNASMAVSGTGIVPGVLSNPTHMSQYRKNESNYLRILTARYDNLTTYQDARYKDDPTPSVAQVSILAMPDSSTDSGSSVSSSADYSNMPIVGEVTDFGVQGANSSIVSTLFEDNGMYIVVTSALGNATLSILYTIDASTPNNPRLTARQTELEAYSRLYLYRVDENSLLGVGDLYRKRGTGSDMDDPFRILLLNVSRQVDAPSLPVLVDQWQNDDDWSQTNGSRTEAMKHITEFYDHEALWYISDLNILVVPGRTDQYVDAPCETDMQMPDQNQNASDIVDTQNGSERCQFGSSTLFNGFWLFKVDATATETNKSTITKHLAIDHASSELLRQSCVTNPEALPRSLVFDGDVMTIKKNAVQSYDVLTKTEAAPAAVLNAGCTR